MASAYQTKDLRRCKVSECAKEPELICLTCGDEPFCQEHKKVHKLVCSDHTVVDHQLYTDELMRDRSAKYCTEHSNIKISLACGCCYQPMCRKCIDIKSSERCPDTRRHANETHLVRSLDLVAETLQKRLQDKMGELKVLETQMKDQLHHAQKTLDTEFGEDRNTLDLIKTKINEMRVRLDGMEEALITELTENMKDKQKELKCLERDVADFQKQCQNIFDETSQLIHKNDAVIMRNYRSQKERIENMFEYNQQQYKFEKLLLHSEDECLELIPTPSPMLVTLHVQSKRKNPEVPPRAASIRQNLTAHVMEGDSSCSAHLSSARDPHQSSSSGLHLSKAIKRIKGATNDELNTKEHGREKQWKDNSGKRRSDDYGRRKVKDKK